MSWNIATVFALLAAIAFIAYLFVTYVIKVKTGGMVPIVCLLATTVFQAAFVVAMYMRHEPTGNIIPALLIFAIVASSTLGDIAKRRTSS
jgi:hypothetical protein